MERQTAGGCENSSNVSQGCPVPVGNTVCGETDSLEIMKQFNKLYEERMSQVDSEAGGDCLQEKIKLQQEWIKNLTQQNEMLVRAVQELEYEATERVQQLEEKLHKSAQCLCEVMKKYREHDYVADLLAEPLQDISRYENDTKNLLEFIRRARENGNWSLNGLTFLKIPKDQLMGLTPEFSHRLSKGDSEGEKLLEEKDRTLQELTLKLNYYKSFGDVECMARELQTRREECDSLRQEMADMRQALTQEVATKHDQIVILKRDIIQLEERCLQADKQTAFKETIIKELRMEIKQLKQQTNCVTSCELDSLRSKIRTLEFENLSLKETLTSDKTHIEELDAKFQIFLQERDGLKRKTKTLEKKSKCAIKEKEAMRCECEVLKTGIKNLKEQNVRLQEEVKSTKSKLETITSESATRQEKLKNVMVENKKAVAQVISLNEENRNLSQSIDLLRQRSEYTNSFTQDEVSKLNITIGELKDNLERTRLVQIEEEKAHLEEISNLNETISSLERQLRDIQEKFDRDGKICKICKGKSKVGFLESSEVQADLGNKELELVKVLSDTKSRMKIEIEKRNNEIERLKDIVDKLEASLRTAEERASNLQEAVTLYSNSVNVLEASAEEAKVEIEQQKVTIANLQEALVEAKKELDHTRKKTQENDQKKQQIIDMLENLLKDTEEENDSIKMQDYKINREYEKLQDLNFSLEVEHFDSLQDIDTLESQLYNYKCLLKVKEEQMKKLVKQKRCYEEVIAYFKNEMNVMAEQLNSLQELLNLSNETAHQESSKIMSAFMEAQNINEQLSSQLCACEQRIQLENQMNQIHEAKISELQLLIYEKETKHHEAISSIRESLNDSLQKNEDLQKTILELNETIATLQGAVEEYELENSASKQSCAAFQEQIGGYYLKLEELKTNLEEKTAECQKLKAAQQQLQESGRLQRDSKRNLVESLESLKQKLKESDENNERLCEECEHLRSQLAIVSRKEAVKDLEIKRYRKIVGDLKSTMIDLNSELNRNLIKKELRCKEGCKGSSNSNSECDPECYQRMVNSLKDSVIDLKKNLNETQQRNKQFEEELRQKDAELANLHRVRKELDQNIRENQENARKMADMQREIDRLTQEVHVRSLQVSDIKKSANEINSSKCVQLACAQEEIANLKSEMTNLLNKQYILQQENENLHAEAEEIHRTINCLNEKNKMFRDQINQYLTRIRNLNAEKEALLRKNKELTEQRGLQAYAADRQQRLTAESLKELEANLDVLKSNKEEICVESKNVIKNIRAWVSEQKNINSIMAKREKLLIETIKRLSNDKDRHVSNQMPQQNRGRINNSRPAAYSKTCNAACSLDSQGSPSYYDDVESPPVSPDFVGNSEWYSTTFRSTESENESDDDYCVNTLEHLTQQIRKSNKIWMEEKRSCEECRVTRDDKEKK